MYKIESQTYEEQDKMNEDMSSRNSRQRNKKEQGQYKSSRDNDIDFFQTQLKSWLLRFRKHNESQVGNIKQNTRSIETSVY